MIQLRTDCLVFETASGRVPFSAEQVAVELIGDAAELLDAELLHHAAAGVLHYFKEELGRDFVTVGEFSEALARVLRGFGLNVVADEEAAAPSAGSAVPTFDLRRLAGESGASFELAFFQRLREELHRQIAASPRVVRLTGLRGCVKQLLAARRWCPRCRRLSDQIVSYLRQCLREDPAAACALVVE
jgi:hypothetical protein